MIENIATFDEALFNAAKSAYEKAYTPYSNFKVGAAILAENNQIYSGCNVENAAYPEGNCAETIAIANMVLAGQSLIKRIYIVGNGNEPVTPCGGCRQRIREFSDNETMIISRGINGKPLIKSLNELLPFSFGPDHLGNKNGA